MKITIGAIGKIKSCPEKEIFDSYTARIPWKIQVKEFDNRGVSNITKETDFLSSLISNTSGKVIILDELGKTPSSREFSKKIEEWQVSGVSELTFLIGGANGHSDKIKKAGDYMLSFGKMTWPHMLVRPMLAEQLYRAYTILSGHPYHKG